MAGFAPYGVVAIGRNEGERLKQCIASTSGAALTVYVDSGSRDGSAEWAEREGVEVVALDMSLRFTAARARNAGFARLRKLAPHINYVQFVDGDCELVPEWPRHAIEFLESDAGVCAVFGRRRERYPDRSIYNRICDEEWNVPVGKARACGGDVMMRVAALEQADGYRDDFIAGEEPELCVRLRAAGWSAVAGVHRMGDMAQVRDALDAQLASLPVGAELVLVGHGVGGLLVRQYAESRPALQIRHVVTLGTPHQGSRAVPYRWLRAPALPPAPNEPRVDVIAIYSDFDAWLVPIDDAYCPRGFNIAVRGVGHCAMLQSRRVADLIAENLAAPAPSR